MRLSMFVLGAVSLVGAAGCGASPDGQSDEDLSARVASPLETTGQVDFYVQIVGMKTGALKGESTVAAFKDQLPAFRFKMNERSPHDPATGMASGKVVNDPVTITKAIGAADPQLVQALTTNENLTTIKLSFVKTAPDGKVGVWQTVTFRNAQFTQITRETLTLEDAAKTQMNADEMTFVFKTGTITDTDGNVTATF